MTPEAQRISIAEACGWTCADDKPTEYSWWESSRGIPVPTHGLPDYLNDLNAMHEAEKVLTDKNNGECRRYVDILGTGYGLSRFGKVHATAAQRCEAFLRTLGLWKD